MTWEGGRSGSLEVKESFFSVSFLMNTELLHKHRCVLIGCGCEATRVNTFYNRRVNWVLTTGL